MVVVVRVASRVSPPRARSLLQCTETSLNHSADMMKFAETLLNHLTDSIALRTHACPSGLGAWEREEREGGLDVDAYILRLAF